jgi:predicted metalloprotease with PDZ domain
VDFYDEGVLIWLDADVLIRQKTSGAKSLDDFCRKFFGLPDSEPRVVPYSLEDVVNTLNDVCPNDWQQFFGTRIYSVNPHAPMGGIENGGWKLSYVDSPTDLQTADQNFFKHTDLNDSLGISISNKEETVVDVIPGSPADKAGIAPGAQVVAVNGRRFTPELLRSAIKAAKGSSTPIELLVESDDFFKTAKLDYHNGEKYPRLERDPSKPDVLSEIAKPISSPNQAQKN